MSIKMVATDIDGTIYKHGIGFNQPVIDCIKNLEKNGVKVILITGRMHKSAKKIADILGLKNPIVSYQGALVRDNSEEEKIIYERYIPEHLALKILKWAKDNKIDTNLYLNDNLYVEEANDCTNRYTGDLNVPFTVAPFNTLTVKNVNKILLIDYNDKDRVTRIAEELKKQFPELYIVKSTNYFCEICHPEATKGDGLKCLQEYYGIKKEETLTIGDHNNDIELLLAGGVKVAMGNSSEELKAISDYVTDTVDNDGFVKAIEKFVKVGANV